MMNKFIAIIIVAIIAIIAIGLAITLGTDNNNEPSDSTDWQTKELAGVEFKVPPKYEQGATMTGNIIDGVDAGNSYQSGDLLITANNNNWSAERDNYMGSNSVMTVIQLNGNEIEIFTANGNSIAFFEAKNNNITLTWSGDTATGDIKAIILSFF